MALTEARSIAAKRSESEWNDRFAHWERPASDSEEKIIEHAASEVRKAVFANTWLTSEKVEIRPQGSYHNNTNVRQESDMDLCAWHPAIKVEWSQDADFTEYYKRNYTDRAGTIAEIMQTLKSEVGEALAKYYGGDNVAPGSKAFRVHAIPGSRSDADVVPAMRFDWLASDGQGGVAVYQGIMIYPSNGQRILNFPEQHHKNGKTKRANTQHRFKKNVRILKWLRDELVELGRLQKGTTPSFLIESLVYRVPDEDFLKVDSRYERALRILFKLSAWLDDDSWTGSAKEINDLKLLFHSTQPWTVQSAKSFVNLALVRMVNG